VKTKRILLSIFLFSLLFSSLPLFGAGSVIIKEISGKVDIRLPETEGWEEASEGREIPLNSDISTGFRSHAVLDLGTSEIVVMALTRMTVQAIVDDREEVSTSLLLNAGSLRADVKTSSTRTHDFTITSPIATAAVRGTSFIFNGYTLTVLDGIVLYANTLGERIYVKTGTSSRTTGTTIPVSPEVVIEEAVTTPTVPVAAGDETEPPPEPLTTSQDSGLPPPGLTLEIVVR